jgi:hypothetical protein
MGESTYKYQNGCYTVIKRKSREVNKMSPAVNGRRLVVGDDPGRLVDGGNKESGENWGSGHRHTDQP